MSLRVAGHLPMTAHMRALNLACRRSCVGPTRHGDPPVVVVPPSQRDDALSDADVRPTEYLMTSCPRVVHIRAMSRQRLPGLASIDGPRPKREGAPDTTKSCGESRIFGCGRYWI
jgi:hypothetical protein